LTNTNITLTEAFAATTTQLKTAQQDDIATLKCKVTRLKSTPQTRTNPRNNNRKPKPATRTYFNKNIAEATATEFTRNTQAPLADGLKTITIAVPQKITQRTVLPITRHLSRDKPGAKTQLSLRSV
jgi:hypothetical protein